MTESAVRSVRPAAPSDAAVNAAIPSVVSFTDLAMSASGSLAFTQRTTPEDTGEIVVWNAVSGGRAMMLQGGRSPAWSSDGRKLAYLSGRHRDEVVVVPDVGTSEGTASVRFGEDVVVASVAWMPDADRLLVVAAPVEADGSVSDGALRHQPHGWPERRDGHRGVRRIAVVDTPDAVPVWIDLGRVSVWEASGFPDGRMIAVVSEDPTESGWYGSRLSVIDGTTEVAIYEPEWQIASPSVSPTGELVALIEGWASDRGHLVGDLVVLEPNDRRTTVIPGGDIGLDVRTVQWIDARRLWVGGWKGFHTAWATVDAITGRILDGGIVDRALSIVPVPGPDEPNHAVVKVRDDDQPVVEVLADDPSHRRSADVPLVNGRNPAGGRGLERSILRWHSIDGLEIEGLLLTAREREPLEQRLIVMVHGGPANLWSDVPPLGARSLVDAGYAVLLPNPRGSVGRGQEFARANLGDPAGAELDDLISGADTCRLSGLVMDARPGVVGGSYGGYLAACAAVFSAEVAAAVAMFGHPDLISARLSSNNAAFYDRLLGGTEEQVDTSLAYDRSPVFHVDRDAAPVLLLHGDRDACTPLGQSEELFGALVGAGVDTELVVYPGAGHGLRGTRTQLDVWTRTAGWFDRHLRGVGA